MNIGWAKNPVQEYNSAFFKKFSLIIGGLDNMEARRWLNQLVHEYI